MSFSATRWAWQQRGLSPAQRCTLLSLADRAGEDHTCYPSLQRIALDTEQDIKTVRKSIKILCEKGLIGRTERTGSSCTYQLIGVEAWKNSVEVPHTNSGTPTNLGTPAPLGTPTAINSPTPNGTPANSGTPTTIAVYPYQFGADPLPSTCVSQEQSKEPMVNLDSPLPPTGDASSSGGDEIPFSPCQKKNAAESDRSAFDLCFAAYPVKQAQEEAWRAWKTLKRASALPDTQKILQAIQAHVETDSRWKRGKIPLMKNWLSSKRWLDQPYVEGDPPQVQHDSFVPHLDTASLVNMPHLVPTWEMHVDPNRTLSLPTDILAALRGDAEAKKRIGRISA